MKEIRIANYADNDVFEKQCIALEKNIPGLKKTNHLTDVDGSEIVSYSLAGKELKVLNSYYLDEVLIRHDIPLTSSHISLNSELNGSGRG